MILDGKIQHLAIFVTNFNSVFYEDFIKYYAYHRIIILWCILHTCQLRGLIRITLLFASRTVATVLYSISRWRKLAVIPDNWQRKVQVGKKQKWLKIFLLVTGRKNICHKFLLFIKSRFSTAKFFYFTWHSYKFNYHPKCFFLQKKRFRLNNIDRNKFISK